MRWVGCDAAGGEEGGDEILGGGLERGVHILYATAGGRARWRQAWMEVKLLRRQLRPLNAWRACHRDRR